MVNWNGIFSLKYIYDFWWNKGGNTHIYMYDIIIFSTQGASRQEERRNLPTRDHGTSAKLNELVTELNLFQLWGKQLKGLLKEVMDADDLNMMS